MMHGWAEHLVPDQVLGAVAIRARNRLPRDVVGELLCVLAEEPPLVLCDLTGLAPAGGDLLLVDLEPVSYYIGHWPGTVVVLHTTDEAVSAELTAAHLGCLVLVHDSWIRALTQALDMLPVLSRKVLYLPPVPSSAGQARAFVAQTLRAWQMSHLIDRAVLVASELVTNSQVHARTVLDLAVSHTDARLRIAVGDHGPGIPMQRLQLAPDVGLSGRGMLLVDNAARGWGVLPRRTVGKTVWAVLECAADV
jgi:anti-sigma regulatory factor (Ser/Thr protein kinase)